jgi:hypothetical protein
MLPYRLKKDSLSIKGRQAGQQHKSKASELTRPNSLDVADRTRARNAAFALTDINQRRR